MDLKHQLYLFAIRLKDTKTLNYKEFKNLKIFFGLSLMQEGFLSIWLYLEFGCESNFAKFL